MSRIGKQPIPLSQGVTLTQKDGMIEVKGPKGKLDLELHPLVSVTQKDNVVNVSVKIPTIKKQAALWGLFRNLINNMVVGVTVGFSKELEVNGVGYKAAVEGKNLILNVGYSHPREIAIPEGIAIDVKKNIIEISGIDKQRVGQVAAEIRSVRKVEPYKGKGIKYVGEYVRRKAGKAASKAE